MFGSDALLWYNVGKWEPLGLAIPNYGRKTRGQNDTIIYLSNVIGRNLQAVMFHTDARLRTPPSVNTLARIHKLCTRARSILSSRAVEPGKNLMETVHNMPAPEAYVVYPTPYFTVRNAWLKQYCGLILMALTEAFQHQENARPIEISTDFAGLIGQYIQRVYQLMAVELLRIDQEEASKPDFTVTEDHLSGYDPGQWFTSTEMIDTIPDYSMTPTELDLEPLTNGIPVEHLPKLGPWPSGGLEPQGNTNKTVVAESFPPPPGA